jgi:hypothetical protein
MKHKGSGKKIVSLKQMSANRANAQQSTGPKSRAGKDRVRFNALKHGLLRRAMGRAVGDGHKRRRVIARLVRQLRREYQPVGFHEERQVELIAVLYFQHGEVFRFANGTVRDQVEDHIRFMESLDIDDDDDDDDCEAAAGTSAADVDVDSCALPRGSAGKIFLRYERRTSRDLERALQTLHRLQGTRKQDEQRRTPVRQEA